jgi:hypothetical protein
VDPVSFIDFDFNKTGGGEHLLVLTTSQGAGDTAGESLHVSPSGCLHIRVGDHIGNRETAPGPEHSKC